MAKTLTVAGANFLGRYKTNSAEIKETVQNKSNVMTMEMVVNNISERPIQGSEVVFKDGTRFLFGGYITQVEQEEFGIGEKYVYEVEVSDYSHIFNNKTARRAYQNQTLKYIVEDLLDTYVDASYGFDTTNVATGPTIVSVTFDHVSIRKCFEKLQKLTGYVWYVDYEKNVYFTTTTATAAPESITDASANFEEINISYDAATVRNSVIVIGNEFGEEDINTKTETFDGDGETRSWELEDFPSTVVSISINGTPQQFSLDVNERDTDVFIYSFTGKSFRLTVGQTTPVGGGTPDEIEIVYNPRIPIITQEIEPVSIAFFAALDGGDGTYEYTIKDDSVTTKEEATARALEELNEFAMPLVNGEFTTRTSLLADGSIFTAGQVLTVNLPSHDISTDTTFLIQEVNISMLEDEDNDVTEYFYKVRFGGKLSGVKEFIESLASDEGAVTDAEIIYTIESLADSFVVEHGTVTRLNETPPYEYGPAGSPQGRWNMSEWS